MSDWHGFLVAGGARFGMTPGKNRTPTPRPADAGSLTKLVRASVTSVPRVRSSPGTLFSMELEESSRSKRSTWGRSALCTSMAQAGPPGIRRDGARTAGRASRA